LFDFSVGSNIVGKEIVNCIRLDKDGIHAVLAVFSVRTRFSLEEEVAIQTLKNFFGEKIVDYMIVVFTGGDELEDNDETLEDYLGHECPKPLQFKCVILMQEILKSCKNRVVLFDNKARDESKKDEQLKELLSLVNKVIAENGGKPYTDEFFDKLKVKMLFTFIFIILFSCLCPSCVYSYAHIVAHYDFEFGVFKCSFISPTFEVFGIRRSILGIFANLEPMDYNVPLLFWSFPYMAHDATIMAVIECILGLSSFVEGAVGSLNLKIPLFERK
ncbi:hypothetical protein IFM89_012098, partial [Coptis chinensis]